MKAMGGGMISFTAGDAVFSLRVAGVLIRDGHVVLHRATGDANWALPGGRAELMETGDEAIRREMWEELGVAVQVGRLLWVVENFYSTGGRQMHGLGLYFMLTLVEPGQCPVQPEPWLGHEDGGVALVFKWFAIDDLRGTDLRPSFLVDALAKYHHGLHTWHSRAHIEH